MTFNDEKKRNITLHLYDTTLSVNIPLPEEEYYRTGAQLVTGVMNSYMTRYRGIKTDKEIQYMALIDIALRYVHEAAHSDLAPIVTTLKTLTTEIEEAMQ